MILLSSFQECLDKRDPEAAQMLLRKLFDDFEGRLKERDPETLKSVLKMLTAEFIEGLCHGEIT